MKKTSPANALADLEARYRQLAQKLGQAGYISQGSVYERKAGASGSRYQWSWKDPQQKTKSLSLSKEQFEWLKEAIKNQKNLQHTLKQMRRISHQILLKHIPGNEKRKPLKISSLHLI